MRSFQWGGRVDMIPNQKANSNWHQLAREKFIFFHGLSLCILATFKCKTTCIWPTQNEISDNFLSYEFAWYFFLFIFSFIFLILFIIHMYVMVFDSLIFVECVYVCMDRFFTLNLNFLFVYLHACFLKKKTE